MDLLKIIQQIWEIAINNSRLTQEDLSNLVEISYSPFSNKEDHWVLILKINELGKNSFEEKIYLSQISTEMATNVDNLFEEIKQALKSEHGYPVIKGSYPANSFIATKIGCFFFHQDGRENPTMRISPHKDQVDSWEQKWKETVVKNVSALIE